MLRSLRGNSIYVDLSNKQLHFYEQSTLSATYPVAIGKSSTPSPIGTWQVINKKIMNYDNLYGSRWMGLSAESYGIHGTNNPSSIGTSVSLGCIRMFNHDVEELFLSVGIGTPVIITTNFCGPDGCAQNILTNTTGGHSYTVKPGDTFWKIGQMYNIPTATLIKLNNSINPNTLIPGQIIYLP